MRSKRRRCAGYCAMDAGDLKWGLKHLIGRHAVTSGERRREEASTTRLFFDREKRALGLIILIPVFSQHLLCSLSLFYADDDKYFATGVTKNEQSNATDW